ncbi:HAD-IB family hydrolase [candidate division TA06 bacterium]|uniref:HAD-IB family hydrolase n=1 Tax=candidate division TA06 bacterium TaxID=2250710 RepID=A0A933I8I2_UNCT6|nr:HAD-IB family hydrolase [candidate division TA06 bacterium]
MALAFVDVDGTIIKGTSCEKLFIPYLIRNNKLGLRQFFHFAWFALRHFSKYGLRVYKRDKAYLTGLSIEETEQLAKAFIGRIIPERLNPLIIAELERHRTAGDELVLLSGTPEFLAEPLGRKLGIENIIACKVLSLNGCYTSGDPAQHPYGQSKLQLAREYCLKRGASLEKSAAYADKSSDLPLLEQVGTAVAVTPVRRLRKVALTKDWRIIG